MARADGKIRCTSCEKYRDPEDIRSTTRSGGGTYRRGGRDYAGTICRQCCIDLANMARAGRYANPGSMKDGEFDGRTWNYHLEGQKAACEKFGVPVDDLPRNSFDRSGNYDRPKHPIDFSVFDWQYKPGDVEKIKAYWRSMGAVASLNKSSNFSFFGPTDVDRIANESLFD